MTIQTAVATYALPMPPTAEADPAYTLDPSDAGDTAIRPNSIVRILASSDECPLYVRVLRVYTDDTLKVQSLCVPAVQWRENVEDVALVLVDGVA